MRRVVSTVLFALLALAGSLLNPTRVRSDEAAGTKKVTPTSAVAPETISPKAGAASPAPLQTYTLQFQFAKGESSHYAVRQQNELEVEYNEVAEKTRSQANSVRHFKVLDVDSEGVATLELCIDRCYMTATQNGTTVTYDSTKPEAEVPSQFYQVAAMLGRPSVQIKMSPNGKVVGITSLLGQAVDSLTADDQKLDVLFTLPEKPVAIGDQWSETSKAEVAAAAAIVGGAKESVTILRKYTLTGVKEGVATIGLQTIILTPNIDAEKQTQLVQKLWKGEIRFDIAKGRMLARRQEISEEVAGFSNKTGLLTVHNTRLDLFAPADKLAAVDLKPSQQD